MIKAPFRGEDASYAYGLWVSETQGHTLLRHTGGMVAFSSAMYADVTAGFAAFASVNAARLPGGYRPLTVIRYALALLGAAARGEALPEAPPPPAAPATVKNAADYAGTYTGANGSKLVLTSGAEQLILQNAGVLQPARLPVVLERIGDDSFLVKHPDFALFALNFAREKDVVTEVSHGENWWANERYTGARKFDYPKEWHAYTGHFHSDSPWYGSVRVVIRKGELLVADSPMAPVAPQLFRPADDSSDADRVVFDNIVDGRAMRLNYSGIEFFRIFTP